MKNFFLIASLFISFLCSAQSTSLELVLERPIEFSEEYGYVHYIKDAGNGKIIFVTYLFTDDHQWIPWIYDTQKDTVYSIGINDNIFSTNVNGFYSTYFGSQSPPPYHSVSDLDVFAIRDGKIYFSAIQQDTSLPRGNYLYESNGLPNGTKIVAEIPDNYCDAYEGLFFNTPEKLFYFSEPYDCQDSPFRIYSFETDTFIEKTTIPYDEINYFRYLQNNGHFYIAMNDQLISIDNQTGQYEYILDSLNQFLIDPKYNGSYFTQLIPKKNEVYALLNTYYLNIFPHPIFGDIFMGTGGVYSSKIWKTDGTKEGTQEFINIELDTSKNLSARIFVSHDRLYFGGVLIGENTFSIYDITDGELNKVFTYENPNNNSLFDIRLYNDPFQEIFASEIPIPLSLENKKDYIVLHHDIKADLISINPQGNFNTEFKDFSTTIPYIESDGTIQEYQSLIDIKSFANNIYFMNYDTVVRYKIQEFNDETKTLRLLGSEFKDTVIDYTYEYLLKTDDGLYFINRKLNEAENTGIWKISSCENNHTPIVSSEEIGNNSVRYTITNSVSDSYTWLVENATIINKGYDYIEIKWENSEKGNILVYGIQKYVDGICMSKTTSINEKVTSISNNETALQMSLFPNPANSKINIQFPEYCEGILKVLSINGAIMKSEIVKGKESTIDVSNLLSGTYILIFEGNKSIQTLKLSIVK